MGREEGYEEGYKEGLIEGLQKAFVILVEVRFPSLAELAQQNIVQITKPDQLDLLIQEIVHAPDETIVRWILSTIAA